MKCPHLRQLAENPGLVLASGSPRRKFILTELGLKFDIEIPVVEEKLNPDLIPEEQAVWLSQQKARSFSPSDQRCYLSCDTIVVLDGQILGKPTDGNDARRILKTLSGRTHTVITGLTLRSGNDNTEFSGSETSRVTFNDLDDPSINQYIASGEPLDKAGAYGIQGMGGFLVDSVEGNIDNVIGLPVTELNRLAELYLELYDQY